MKQQKFRIREQRMFTGEVRFIPEIFLYENNAMISYSEWYLIGTEKYYSTFEQARQQIDQYKIQNSQGNYTEIIHNIE